jgi:hypothetical protein
MVLLKIQPSAKESLECPTKEGRINRWISLVCIKKEPAYVNEQSSNTCLIDALGNYGLQSSDYPEYGAHC